VGSRLSLEPCVLMFEVLIQSFNSRIQSSVIKLVAEVHKEHPSHGYRWVCAYIRINLGVTFSENYVYKAFRYLGIKAETKHKKKNRPRKIKDKYPNLIFSTYACKKLTNKKHHIDNRTKDVIIKKLSSPF